jgi:hypothetical protein
MFSYLSVSVICGYEEADLSQILLVGSYPNDIGAGTTEGFPNIDHHLDNADREVLHLSMETITVLTDGFWVEGHLLSPLPPYTSCILQSWAV